MPQFSPLALFVTALLASMVTPSMKAHSESLTPKAAAMTDAASDPLLWLEEVEGKTALDWVAAENKRSLDALQADPRYEALHTAALKIVNASDRVPMPSFRAGGIDNFWQDKDAVRGVWRRTSLDSYRTKTPQWETVLDIDALSKSEAANWVYKGSNCLAPEERLCLVSLSDGGKDAVEVREFDTAAKAFVKDGFALPAGKQQAAWIDKDTLLVGREWTPGLVTESGYPFVIKRLKRGQALSQATEVFAGAKGDVGVWPGVIRDADGRHVADYVTRAVGFFDSEVHILTPKGSVRLLVPTKSSFQAYLDGQAIFTLEEAWTAPNGKAFAQGALISFDLAKAIGDPKAMDPVLILAPNARQSIEGVTTTRNRLLVTMTTNVVGEVWSYAHGPKGWSGQALNLPKNASLGLVSANDLNDQVFVSVTSFLSPTSLWLGNADAASLSEVKAAPARFDASDLVTEQFEATSKDGTKIPYFVVRKKALVLDGTAPTLLYAYGGFQVSMTPAYSGLTGKLWLERGGVYVLANIRGGGEFGPAWHQAGLKTKRQAIYDDFAAVAEDLITRKITSPRHLGIQGGSNGGLLMGVQMTQRPELWRAVVVQVPLLDMLRYNQLLAGASWVDEYGDPADPAEGAFLRQTSPYQNLKTGVDYPEPFFVTSTKDDRVHPAHARKMAARMQAMGLPFLYYENTDGGHSAAANLKEVAKRVSLEFTYLTRKLMD